MTLPALAIPGRMTGIPKWLRVAGWSMVLCLPLPAQARDFSPGPVGTRLHATPDLAQAVTHDPTLSEPYAISLTLALGVWPDAPVFAMRFDGPYALVIHADRHGLSADGRTLRVADRVLGNVPEGIGRNVTATALPGPLAVSVPLVGADESRARLERTLGGAVGAAGRCRRVPGRVPGLSGHRHLLTVAGRGRAVRGSARSSATSPPITRPRTRNPGRPTSGC